eukprot:TRINITY_DN19542_c0_g1_i1.p1 TRINITY_DN19542_c0_g1~~TRINITY_DN19542_c0_g1_i1.p1  ORF type:complete len:659 (-),score=127.21 TRINITY_DN19542_c0_g1_i1:64-2040(-)
MSKADEDNRAFMPTWLLSKAPKEDADTAELDEARSMHSDAESIARRKLETRGIVVEGAYANLMAAPKAPVGSAVQERHRVTQVCLGAQHGVLLVDAGIAFTWGDNRFGQLGRPPVLKEENGEPFPVLALLGEEVLQVAAGTHHCLALVAPGLVWSWGRNKAGQLGTGTLRDEVKPVKVCHSTGQDHFAQGTPLGQRNGEGIVTISAGMDSSVAAAINSEVWQWGEISKNFVDAGSHAEKNSKQGGLPVITTRPHCIFRREQIRTGMRSKRESVSERGCRVYSGQSDLVSDEPRLMGLVQAVRALQAEINNSQLKLAEIEKELKAREEDPAVEASHEGDEQTALNDTIGTLERDIMLIDRDIDAYKKSLASCDLRQKHNRDQLQKLQSQATNLRDKQDDISLKMYAATKGSAERRRQEEAYAEVEQFVEANKNTRMTLLDQRAETDKEKQRIVHVLGERRRQRERQSRRLDTLRDLSKSSKASSGGTLDSLVKLLAQQTAAVTEHFDRRAPERDYLTAMKIFDHDESFLAGVEAKMKEMADSVTSSAAADPARAERAQVANHLLRDLVNLRRQWCSMLRDRWSSDGLDLSCFFKNASRPSKGDGSAVPDAMATIFTSTPEALALQGSPQMPAIEPRSFLNISPDDEMGGGRIPAITTGI